MSKSHSSGKKKTSREMRRRRRACMVWLERGMIAFWIIARWYWNGCLSECAGIKIKPSASQGGKPYGDLGL